MGHIVADGVVVQTDNSGFPSFGLTQDGNFCLGMLNASQVTTMAFEQLLTGFGWLLFNGTVQVLEPGGWGEGVCLFVIFGSPSMNRSCVGRLPVVH